MVLEALWISGLNAILHIDNISQMYNRCHGVPQGSVLGPLLFILYINDITQSSNKLIFTMFADDTSLLLKIDRNYYHPSLKNELKNIMDWFKSNYLLLNCDKTDYLYCGPHFRKNTIKGEHNLSEFHEYIPQYTIEYKILPNYMYQVLDDEGPHTYYSKINENGEFVFDELHRVVPQYVIKEHTVTESGLIVKSNKIKYLGVIFDSDLNFKNIFILLQGK